MSHWRRPPSLVLSPYYFFLLALCFVWTARFAWQGAAVQLAHGSPRGEPVLGSWRAGASDCRGERRGLTARRAAAHLLGEQLLPAQAEPWFEEAELEFFHEPTTGVRCDPDSVPCFDMWDSCLRYNCSEDERCRASPPGPVPCCETMLLRLASDVGRVLRELNLTYFAAFGTLLGIMRNGSVQPNGANMDVDLLLDAASFDALASPVRGTMARYALYKKVT